VCRRTATCVVEQQRVELFLWNICSCLAR